MTKLQFADALALARSGQELGESVEPFDGFATKAFRPVVCTIVQLAALIRWQAIMFNGSVDSYALTEIWDCRQKFVVM